MSFESDIQIAKVTSARELLSLYILENAITLKCSNQFFNHLVEGMTQLPKYKDV